MKLLNHEYRSGMKQGSKGRMNGLILVACPYRQWPLSQLRKYKAWVNGWYKTFHIEIVVRKQQHD